MSNRNRRVYRRLIVAAVTLAVGAVVWILGSTAYVVNEYEADYVAACQAVELVTHYVKHRNEWPQSWEELQEYGNAISKSEGFLADVPWVRERITIDFTVQVASLKTLNAIEIHAIEPKRPNALFDDEKDRLFSSMLGHVKQLSEVVPGEVEK